MDCSLSIVIPIRNAAHRVETQVHRLLDLMADMTSKFEILVVDSAATEQTEEIGQKLKREFPQVEYARIASNKAGAAVEFGLQNASGDVVFVHEGQGDTSAAQMKQLWALRNDQRLVMARADMRPAGGPVVERLVNVSDEMQDENSAGIQMIRREGASKMNVTRTRSTTPSRVDIENLDVSCRRPPNFISRTREMAATKY